MGEPLLAKPENHPIALPLKEAVTIVNTPEYNSVISLTTSALKTTPTTGSPTVYTSKTVSFMISSEIPMPEATKQATSSTNTTSKAMPSTTADISTATPNIITLMALNTSANAVIPTSEQVYSRPTTNIQTVPTTITAKTLSTAIAATVMNRPEQHFEGCKNTYSKLYIM
ncbi:hypothetical protein CHS0354_037934 [Potamilus streckersoni]|uniref:Uncharacterized protein n=1 Tax=Potamilus streckersoni TaxID=2493646 RepID=A0AAE0W9D1_9BIVA|nr:hypothetical protein CHS0354_037934 [Potamilus streckersoni]